MLTNYLEVVSGDTLAFNIVLRAGALPVDITDFTFSGGVRSPGSTSNMQNFQFNVLDAFGGVIRVYLSPEQTRKLPVTSKLYEWSVRVNHADYTKTLRGGALRVVKL